MKKVFCYFLFLSFSTLMFSQDTLFCGFDALHRNLVEEEPVDRSDTVEWNEYTIPVIVHICHSGEPYGTENNISDEEVFASIEKLNDVFSGQHVPNNSGINPTMSDTKIRFCMANMTDTSSYNYGIQRHNMFEYDWFVEEYGGWGPPFSAPGFRFDCYEYDYMCIDYENTLNIWVAPWQGSGGIQALGAINTPLNNLGGVTIKTYHFKSSHNNLQNDAGIAIFAHEVGHCFGLKHIFAYTDTCEDVYNETDCSSEGDHVCDTPPTVPITCWMIDDICPETSDEDVDIIVSNIMNYTTHCSYQFTDGQIDRMQWKIQNTSRIQLTYSECSCSQEESCSYDLNDNGLVDLQDLLTFLVNIGSENDCTYGDFTNDGYINTIDLLYLLGYMGFNCVTQEFDL
jgi:hypothetical protein